MPFISEFEENFTSSGILDAATETNPNLISQKSRKIYDKVYQHLMDWKREKQIISFSEDILLTYFQEMSDKFKCSSLWSKYSMIKKTLYLYNKVDVSNYRRLLAFLKRKSQGYTGKQAKTFSPEQLNTFINEAPGRQYLFAKVALIFGITGACRRQELHRLQLQDVEVYDKRILVIIRDKKNNKGRSFNITGKYFDLCKEYIALRPKSCNNPYFFLIYQCGKCTQQNVGINKFGSLGKTIADYLKLPNSERYTGHCFRRTSESLLVGISGDITGVRRQANRRPLQVTLE